MDQRQASLALAGCGSVLVAPGGGDEAPRIEHAGRAELQLRVPPLVGPSEEEEEKGHRQAKVKKFMPHRIAPSTPPHLWSTTHTHIDIWVSN